MSAGRPGAPASADACNDAFDRDGNLQIDLADFAHFQREFGTSAP